MSKILEILKKAQWEREKLKTYTDNKNAANIVSSANKSIKLFPIASGKGGTGKTNVAVALSLSIAKAFPENNILLIDGDLGLPNVDLILGLRSQKNINHFFSKKVKYLNELIAPTNVPNLFFICGAEGSTLNLGNLYYQQTKKFILHLKKLIFDYIIIDLGASVNREILDFFTLSPTGIIVVNPEPTSIRDGYTFIKDIFFRKLRLIFRYNTEIIDYINIFEDPNLNQITNINQLLIKLQNMQYYGDYLNKIKSNIFGFNPKIIINKTTSFTEGINVARKMHDDIKSNYNINMSYIGPIFYDKSVTDAVKQKVPFYTLYPNSKPSQCVDIIRGKIVNNDEFDLSKSYTPIMEKLRKVAENE